MKYFNHLTTIAAAWYMQELVIVSDLANVTNAGAASFETGFSIQK